MTLNKWIPVTGKLPEEGVDVLATVAQPRNPKGFVTIAKYYPATHLRDACWLDEYKERILSFLIKAWQPLPEPYQTTQDEINDAIKKTEEHFEK